MVSKELTHRLELYILMEKKGYLSMGMMISIFESLAVTTKISIKDIITEHERLSCLIKIKSSELYFYADITGE